MKIVPKNIEKLNKDAKKEKELLEKLYHPFLFNL